MKQKKKFLVLISLFTGIYLFYLGLNKFNSYLDLTNDKRYTLASSSHKLLDQLNQPLRIDIFLGGELPPQYKRLRSELETLLNQITHHNKWVYFEFIDPFEGQEENDELIQSLYQYGLAPEIDINQESQSTERTLVVPWMILNQDKKSVRVSLLQKSLGDTAQGRIEKSIQQLEYQLFDGIHQLLVTHKKRIAVIRSHKTSDDIKITNLLQGLIAYYNIAPFDLKALAEQPEKTLSNLLRFDLLIISNPKEPFTAQERFMLDQYTQAGKSSLFFIDAIQVANDSLFSLKGESVAYPSSSGLEELFFKFGLRLNQDLVQDLYCASIVLAQGENEQTNYIPYLWPYYPLAKTNSDHPIGKAVGNVLQRFVSSIDTLPSKLKRIPLVSTSPLSKILSPPLIVSLSEANKPLAPNEFKANSALTGVIVEGHFPALYENRINPFKWQRITHDKAAKIALFSDGNFAENQIDKGNPLELGYDKWTNNLYANKTLINNTVHYLLQNDERLSLRSKGFEMAFLDPVKLIDDQFKIRVFVFGIPLFILALSAFVAFYYRKNRFGQ